MGDRGGKDHWPLRSRKADRHAGEREGRNVVGIDLDSRRWRIRVWWPYRSAAGDLAMTVLQGHARWHPQSRGWYVSAKKREEIYRLLTEL
jgi:hypothetical protein